MKKILIVILSLAFILSLSACGKKDEMTYLGVNAEILEISQEEKGMLVKGLDRNSILGEEYYIDCNDIKVYFIKVIDSKPIDISFEDFSVGDRITVNITRFADKKDEVLGLQLKTRKKDQL